MNAKTKAAVIKHGENLLKVFPLATVKDPVKLCRKLRRLESRGAALGLRMCNGPEYPEGEEDKITENILAKVDTLLNFKASGVPVFVNRDPRGYALKIDDKWLQEHKPALYSDWGGYGIIAPDLTEGGGK